MGLVAVVAALLVWDALIETDTERLEQLVEDSHGAVTRARLAEARDRWVDLAEQPFEVSAFSAPQVFTEGDDEALDALAERGLQGLIGSTVRVLSTHISVEEDRGTVELRLLTDRGLVRADWGLRKRGDRWLAARLHVQRG